MQRWFSSDWHLGHENIIRFCGRPFDNAAQMDEALITLHNERVKPEDHFTTLGDCTILRGGRVQQEIFSKLLKRFNGHKRAHLGNHDHFPIKFYAEVFEKVYATWRDEGGLLFSHFPLHPTSLGSAKACVHGHIHQHDSPPPAVFLDKDGKTWIKPFINISVDVTNFRPLHYDEVLERVRIARESYVPS